MPIICKLCGDSLNMITNTHLKYKHNGITQFDYSVMFPGMELYSSESKENISRALSYVPKSPEHCNHMSEAASGKVVSESTREKMSRTRSLRPLSEEHRKAISRGNIGSVHTEETKRRLRDINLYKTLSQETRDKISQSSLGRECSEFTRKFISERTTGRVFSESHKANISKGAKLLWSNPEYVEKQEALMYSGMRPRPWKPSLPELILAISLESNFPGVWKYNGSGDAIRVGRFTPDFIRVDGTKEVIELFGEYWHCMEVEGDRELRYNKLGYRCLVIWENTLWVDYKGIKSRVESFMNEKEVH